MALDPACEDLAEHFFDDPRRIRLKDYGLTRFDELRRRLAERIQEAVDDWFAKLEAGDVDD